MFTAGIIDSPKQRTDPASDSDFISLGMVKSAFSYISLSLVKLGKGGLGAGALEEEELADWMPCIREEALEALAGAKAGALVVEAALVTLGRALGFCTLCTLCTG